MNRKDSELCDKIYRMLPKLSINPEEFTEPTVVASVLDGNKILRESVERRKNKILYRLGLLIKI